MLGLLCTVAMACPVGTSPGLLHLLWMLTSERLLLARRGRACIERRWLVRASDAQRAGGGRSRWTSEQLLTRWDDVVQQEGRWQPHTHGTIPRRGRYHSVLAATDAGAPTTHYQRVTGQALPTIPCPCRRRLGPAIGRPLCVGTRRGGHAIGQW